MLRSHRALFDFMGQISHDLCGTVTTTEFHNLWSKIDANRDSLDHVIIPQWVHPHWGILKLLMSVCACVRPQQKKISETLGPI